MDDPTKTGDLFFRTIAQAPFSVQGIALFKETPLMNLVADAALAEANKYGRPDLGLAHRAGRDARRSRQGQVGRALVRRRLPHLAARPFARRRHGRLSAVSLQRVGRRAARGARASAPATPITPRTPPPTTWCPAALKVEYDTSKPEFDFNCKTSGCTANPKNGRITRLTLASNPVTAPEVFDKVIYDPADPNAQQGWVNGWSFLDYVPVVTSYYIAAYAKANGVNLKIVDGRYDLVQPNDTILKRADGSEVKDVGSARQLPQESRHRAASLYDASTGGFPGACCAAVRYA